MNPVERLEWLSAVARDDSLPRSAVQVASVLAVYGRSETGIARPGNLALASETGLSKSTVIRTLARLELAGWVRRGGGGYRDMAVEWHLVKGVSMGDTLSGGERVSFSPVKGVILEGKGVILGHKGCHPGRHPNQATSNTTGQPARNAKSTTTDRPRNGTQSGGAAPGEKPPGSPPPQFAKVREQVEEVMSLLRDRTRRRWPTYRPDGTPTTGAARICEALLAGYTLDDLRGVVAVKAREWLGSDMASNLRPGVLFDRHLDDYIGQLHGDDP